MSYPGSISDAKSAIASVELSESSRSTKTSPVYGGSSGPGGAAEGVKPAGEHLTQRRTKLKTSTDGMRRKYASTGTGGE